MINEKLWNSLWTDKTNKHKTHNNIRRSRRRKTYTDLNIWDMKLTKEKSLSRGWHKAMKHILFYQITKLQQKALPREEKKRLQTAKLKHKTWPENLQKSKSLSQEDKYRKTRQRHYLSGREFKAVRQGLGIRRDDKILRRRRQGKTKTLYTWGRETQVQTIRD